MIRALLAFFLLALCCAEAAADEVMAAYWVIGDQEVECCAKLTITPRTVCTDGSLRKTLAGIDRESRAMIKMSSREPAAQFAKAHRAWLARNRNPATCNGVDIERRHKAIVALNSTIINRAPQLDHTSVAWLEGAVDIQEYVGAGGREIIDWGGYDAGHYVAEAGQLCDAEPCLDFAMVPTDWDSSYPPDIPRDAKVFQFVVNGLEHGELLVFPDGQILRLAPSGNGGDVGQWGWARQKWVAAPTVTLHELDLGKE
jgi:hypothetical protein